MLPASGCSLGPHPLTKTYGQRCYNATGKVPQQAGKVHSGMTNSTKQCIHSQVQQASPCQLLNNNAEQSVPGILEPTPPLDH